MTTLNTLEVITNKSDVKIHSTDYNGDWEKLQSLIAQYPSYNFYFNCHPVIKENKIFAWSKSANIQQELPSIFKPHNISNNTHPTVWNKMIELAFVNFFLQINRNIYQKKHSYTWQLQLKQDAKKFIEKGAELVPTLNLAFNFVQAKHSNKIVHTLSLTKSYRHKITFTDEICRSNNIDTRNWQRNDEKKIVNSLSNFKKLLEVTGNYQQYLAFKKDVYSAKSQHDNLEFFEKELNLIKNRLYFPDGLRLEKLVLNNLPSANFRLNFIPRPAYYFYNEKTGNGYYNERVQKLKPVTYNSFKERKINILVVTPKEYEGSTGSFITKIVKTLSQTFHLNNINSKIIAFEHNVKYAYSNLLKQLDVTGYDIVIQVASQIDKKRTILTSPYHHIKAKVLNQKVPAQTILIETIRSNNINVIGAIALNIYSKIGGVAWTIEKDEKDKTEIIVGISSTVDFNKNRILGFANVLDYRGRYITGDCTQLSNFKNYTTNLEQHLVKTIQKVIKEKGIKEKENFRLIFHLTKEAGKKRELKAIANALKKFNQYNIQFAILHLSYGHNYRIYDYQLKKIEDKTEKTVMQPKKGSIVQLSSNQALLHLGSPSKAPILIRLDKRSTYRDIYEATKQVMYFAHLSHTSYRPANRPVTISYPAKMAKLLSNLELIPDWDKTMLNSLQEKLWFI